MIHWTCEALKPCLVVAIEFFWGEAAWGFTAGLRRLRLIRLFIIVLCLLTTGLVTWAVVERGVSANRAESSGNYSYYEGKVLEERMAQMKTKIDTQSEDIRKLMEMANTATLLAVRMQYQLEKQQDTLDSGIKVLGALVVTPVLAILWSIFKSGLRRERPALGQHIKGRRDENTHEGH